MLATSLSCCMAALPAGVSTKPLRVSDRPAARDSLTSSTRTKFAANEVIENVLPFRVICSATAVRRNRLSYYGHGIACARLFGGTQRGVGSIKREQCVTDQWRRVSWSGGPG